MAKSQALKPLEKILILCVDRDDDLGSKGEVRTPLVGRNAVLRAAVKLAVKDPEEPDANAMFDAIRTFDLLTSEAKGEEYQVATIAGSKVSEINADRKLTHELGKVLKTFPAHRVILVSDGYSDENVIPIIQSRLPIMSIRRVVIKHSERIEETWAIFWSYLRRFVEDPRYSRWTLGVPGFLLIIFAILAYFNVLVYGGIVTLIVLGIVLFIKGFGIDRTASIWAEKIRRLTLPSPHEQVRIYSAIAATILGIIASYNAGAYVVRNYSFPLDSLPLVLSYIPPIIGDIIQQAISLLVAAIVIYDTGSGVTYYFTHDSRIWRNIVGAVVAISAYPIFMEVSNTLKNPEYNSPMLLYWASVGVILSAASIILVYQLHRKFSDYFTKAGTSGES